MLNFCVLTEKLLQIKQSTYLLKANWKMKTFDSNYFIGKIHFERDDIQNYLVFLPMNRYFKVTANDYISYWKSKGLSSETITPPTTSYNSLTPRQSYYGTKTRVKFTGRCLKQPKVSFDHKKIVNYCTVYELSASSSNSDDPLFIWCSYFH